MNGMDRNRLVDISEQELEEFTCGICREIFIKPTVTKCCRQTYCLDCIQLWLSSHNTCPNDRSLLRSSDLMPAPRIVTNLLNNLKVKCDFQMNGCESIVSLDELSIHLKECPFNPNNKCKNCGFNEDNDEEHNCVGNLMIKSQSLLDENKRLIKENNELKKEIEILKQKTTEDPIIGLNGKKDNFLIVNLIVLY